MRITALTGHKFWKFHAKTGVLQQNFQWKYDTKSPKLHLLILKGQIGKSIPVVEQVSQIMDNYTLGRNTPIRPLSMNSAQDDDSKSHL